jgi:hypothetical protein
MQLTQLRQLIIKGKNKSINIKLEGVVCLDR